MATDHALFEVSRGETAPLSSPLKSAGRCNSTVRVTPQCARCGSSAAINNTHPRMIMTRALSAPPAANVVLRSARTPGLRAAVKGWWAGYRRRRRERLTAELLYRMSDRELKDIGIVRTQLDFGVRRGPERSPGGCRVGHCGHHTLHDEEVRHLDYSGFAQKSAAHEVCSAVPVIQESGQTPQRGGGGCAPGTGPAAAPLRPSRTPGAQRNRLAVRRR